MAVRLNTILVVLSVPALLSAIYWTRKRKQSKAAAAVQGKDCPRPLEHPPPPPEPDSAVTATASITHHQQSHQVLSDNCTGEEVTALVSSPAPAPATAEQQQQPQPALDPAVIAAADDSTSEGQARITGTCDSSTAVMQIADGTDLSQTKQQQELAVAKGKKNPAEIKSPPSSKQMQQQPAVSNSTPATTTADMNNGKSAGRQLTNGSGEDSKVEKDLLLKLKNSVTKKQAAKEPATKKNTPAKKDKTHTNGVSADYKAKSQSPANDAHRAADAVPDACNRKAHDSGGSVGAASVDSGTDVMSPASSSSGSGSPADAKSSERSVDSPGSVFKSDASQGSPCNWGTSDSHSEGSSDSGKGSETQSTSYSPLQQFMPSVSQRMTAHTVYQFEIPADLVGKLIGKAGCTIKQISSSSRARIVVNDYPFENCDHLKICTMEGDRLAINEALRQIRCCFPPATFPNLTLAQINSAPVATAPLYLMEAYPNDVIMSSLVSAGQFFLQQPTHPSHESLTILNHMMAVTYGEADAPAISSPSVGIIVAATVPALPGWYRALIVAVSEDEAFCDVKYVDYGGCSRLETSSLRQIRMDFMNLPFQACECYLADVVPAEGDVWSAAATEFFEKLAQGCVLKAIVAGMTEDGCTLVRLYKTQGMSSLCLNEELVKCGFARWIPPPSVSASE